MAIAGRYVGLLALAALGCGSGARQGGGDGSTFGADAPAAADAPGLTDTPVATGTEAGRVDAAVAAPDAPASGPLRNVVMVVDDGFDPSLPDLKGKLAARYTIECASAGLGADAGADPLVAGADPDFDRARRELVAALQKPDDSCRLREGMEPYDQALFVSANRYRERWNGAMRTDADLTRVFIGYELAEIGQAMQKAPPDARTHGSATAGALAHQNPELRLVLVQYPLLTSDEVKANVKCINQATIDQAMALLADPAVRAAYVGRPRAELDRGLDQAVLEHRVGIVNLSLGVLSTNALEEALVANGCPAVQLEPWRARLSELDREQEKAQQGPSAVVVQSAGNEGAIIDGPADSSDCRLGDPTRLLVGAYGTDGNLADFSNRGRCVDVLGPGKSVLATLPGGWLLPHDGTSFSAPMVARLLSMEAPQPFAPGPARDWVVSLRDSAGRIPPARFPADLVYAPDKTVTTTTRALSITPAQATIPATSAVKLRRLLWILERLSGGRSPRLSPARARGSGRP